MLSRIGHLTRLNAFMLRQLSTINLTKQAQISQKENITDNQVADAAASGDASGATTATTTKTESSKSNQKSASPNRPKSNKFKKPANQRDEIEPKNQQSTYKYSPSIRNPTKISTFAKEAADAISKTAAATTATFSTADPKHQELYKEAIFDLEYSLSLPYPKLIEACQNLINLYDLDASATEKFQIDPIKPRIINKIFANAKNMTIDELLSAANFLSRFDWKKFDQFQSHIKDKLPQFDIGHLLKFVSIMRLLAYKRPEIITNVRDITDTARSRIDEIDSIADAKRALRLFTSENSIVQRIDMRFSSQLADKLTLDDWIELLTIKSKLRQRNIAILDLCTYNIGKLLEKEPNDGSKKLTLTLEQIKNCLLSCGILNYHELAFFKLVLAQLKSILQAAPSSDQTPDWINQNEEHLNTIITSIGMLQLYDESLMDTLCTLLKNNCDRVKLIVSFVHTCGALGYVPPPSNSAVARNFSQMLAAVNPTAVFPNYLTDWRQCTDFLNYVWSLCIIKRADQYLIASVLNKKFFDTILKEKESKDFKTNLLKILNINIHSIFRMENYEGPSLPEDFNLAEYSEILTPKNMPNANNLLISTLAGFRSINKYVKVNLLTPFGILIDAFMIIDKRGNPLPLDKYFNKSSSSDLIDDEIKVAFKLVGYKDQTLINRKINGLVMFQLSLLKEIGYQPLTIYQEELKSASLLNRVALIEKKLKELARDKNK